VNRAKALLDKLHIADVNSGACSGPDGWITEADGHRLVSTDPATGGIAARTGVVLVAAGGSFNDTVAAGIGAAEAGTAVVVVNADLPCVQPRDLLALVGSTPPGGIALVRARDGGTNALSLSSPTLFAPLYGTGSAERFFRHAASLGVEAALADIPDLADDARSVGGTLASLGERLGPRTRAALAPALVA
jgi:2-phospho-L-lactate guanylyltransferase (CobY/MobA/RfbA family)